MKIKGYKKNNFQLCVFQWSTPDEVIRNYSQSRIGVAPPQLFEISRLLNFHDVGKLEGYMWERSGDVIERILPVAIHCDDGIIVVYPGKNTWTYYTFNPGLKNPTTADSNTFI